MFGLIEKKLDEFLFFEDLMIFEDRVFGIFVRVELDRFGLKVFIFSCFLFVLVYIVLKYFVYVEFCVCKVWKVRVDKEKVVVDVVVDL